MKHHEQWFKSLSDELRILTGFEVEDVDYPFHTLYNEGYSVEEALRRYEFGPSLIGV